jgi:hypothetical protein
VGRSLRLVVPALVAAFWVAATPSGVGAKSELVACSSAGYAYAGLMGATGVAGVAATLEPTAEPDVRSGHVAAWVGVGGPAAGPGGADEWLQVGLSSVGDGSIRLYYEVVAPRVALHYVDLGSSAVGRPVRVVVLEIRARPDWWRVWVNGRPVSRPLQLSGSEHRLVPVATAESWRPGRATPSCNTFTYRFRGVRVAAGRGRPWSSFVAAWTLQRSPYAVERRGDGFVATAQLPA